MLKKMNLPNKLTMLRIILVPFFVIAMVVFGIGQIGKVNLEFVKYIALGIYLVASFTDLLDGQIARKQGLVTKFGKIMDPLADKLLVSAGFIMLTGVGIVPAWITFIVIFRDFAVSSLRMFGADNGEAIAAVWSGKVKTVFQMTGISLAIIDLPKALGGGFGSFITNSMSMSFSQLLINVFMTASISLALVATIWSLVDYFVKFKKHINIEQ